VPIQRSRFIKKFGQNVRRERMNKRFSQEKLAEKVDLNLRSVQRVEAGEITILITTAKRIKDALGCSWDELCS
jgi:ribosome-binding protein aMBF1 (putative translation factor)